MFIEELKEDLIETIEDFFKERKEDEADIYLNGLDDIGGPLEIYPTVKNGRFHLSIKMDDEERTYDFHKKIISEAKTLLDDPDELEEEKKYLLRMANSLETIANEIRKIVVDK